MIPRAAALVALVVAVAARSALRGQLSGEAAPGDPHLRHLRHEPGSPDGLRGHGVLRSLGLLRHRRLHGRAHAREMRPASLAALLVPAAAAAAGRPRHRLLLHPRERRVLHHAHPGLLPDVLRGGLPERHSSGPRTGSPGCRARPCSGMDIGTPARFHVYLARPSSRSPPSSSGAWPARPSATCCAASTRTRRACRRWAIPSTATSSSPSSSRARWRGSRARSTPSSRARCPRTPSSGPPRAKRCSWSSSAAPAPSAARVLGAGAFILLQSLVSSYTERWMLILGLTFVLLVLFAPGRHRGHPARPRGAPRVTEAPLLALDRLTRHFGALAAVNARVARRSPRASGGPSSAPTARGRPRSSTSSPGIWRRAGDACCSAARRSRASRPTRWPDAASRGPSSATISSRDSPCWRILRLAAAADGQGSWNLLGAVGRLRAPLARARETAEAVGLIERLDVPAGRSPTASSGSSRSGSPWPRARACFSSTSPPRGCRRRRRCG